MDFKTIITGLLSKAYKLDQGEIDQLLESGENITEETVIGKLLERDTKRVSTLKGDATGKFQEGYAKAKKEERAAFERELKEKLEVDSELTGVELVEHIVAVKSPEAGKGKKTEITEDDVKKHPVYQGLETKYKRDLKAKDEEITTKLSELTTKYQKEETFNAVKAKALTLLDGLNPILPGSSQVAQNQKNWFLNQLKDKEYEIQGDRVVVMKDGKVLEDEHGNSVDFDTFVKTNAADFFEFKKSSGGANPGQNQQQQQQQQEVTYPAGINKPKTFEDLEKLMNDPAIKTDDKIIISDTWDRENGAG